MDDLLDAELEELTRSMRDLTVVIDDVVNFLISY